VKEHNCIGKKRLEMPVSTLLLLLVTATRPPVYSIQRIIFRPHTLICTNKLSSAGYVARMREKRNAYRLLVVKPGPKR
jgi:hypothetical protein